MAFLASDPSKTPVVPLHACIPDWLVVNPMVTPESGEARVATSLLPSDLLRFRSTDSLCFHLTENIQLTQLRLLDGNGQSLPVEDPKVVVTIAQVPLA